MGTEESLKCGLLIKEGKYEKERDGRKKLGLKIVSGKRNTAHAFDDTYPAVVIAMKRLPLLLVTPQMQGVELFDTSL